ncbi:hypothetical protein [Alishewanella jeotgali]|uniref:Uncharacterized protein n=1 Tax=Alishewanella jeotgali KCTC 22429 TaxID=1129374 RepID=H3ZD92_9ALTE|nr:hypothetical protein [Alishewanella jeotgali]EHR41415.1 hypothetical protein AJE_06586 [Alishewanella jeotgali KCTC 22429]
MVSQKFKTVVQDLDVAKIQSHILVDINLDRNRESFLLAEYAAYADSVLASNGLSLFNEDNKDSRFISDSNSWDKKLWTDLRIELEYNFSRKRFNNIVTVMKHLRESGHPDFQPRIKPPKSAASSKNHSADSSDSQSSSNYNRNNFGLGALGGGLAGGVLGKMVGVTFGGVVLGVAVGLAAVYYLNQRNDE